MKGEPRMHIEITPSQAAEFLEKLAHDEDFRRELENSPYEVLRAYGIEVPEEFELPDFKLPPAEEIDALLPTLTPGGPLSVSVPLSLSFSKTLGWWFSTLAAAVKGRSEEPPG